MQASTITAPSSKTAQQLFIKLLPTFCDGSPAKVERGIGASAVYIYSLKNRPYTVIIIMNDKTVINSPPISVTAHNGILSKKPHSSIFVIISAGKVVWLGVPNPADVIIVEIVPCTILNRASISSRPQVITPLAMANLMNSFNACSGFLTSVKLPQVRTTPTTKKSTSKASPIA